MAHDGRHDAMTAFVRAVELGGFSAAARALDLTPSAMSKVVSRLETRLGVRLINRTTRKLSLTPEGQIFFDRCRAILSDIEDAEHAVTSSRQRPRGRLRLHVAVGFALHQLVPVLPRFAKRYPEVELDLIVEDAALDLRKHDVDISVRPGPGADAAVVARTLFGFRRTVCASPEYVARRGTPRHPDDLGGHDCIVLSGFGNAPRWRFSERVVEVAPSLRVNNADCALRLALLGAGIARLSEFVPARAIREERLVVLLDDFVCAEETPMLMMYQHNRHRLPRVAAMLEFLTASFAHAPWRTPTEARSPLRARSSPTAPFPRGRTR